jgi:hypothetical protein
MARHEGIARLVMRLSVGKGVGPGGKGSFTGRAPYRELCPPLLQFFRTSLIADLQSTVVSRHRNDEHNHRFNDYVRGREGRRVGLRNGDRLASRDEVV